MYSLQLHMATDQFITAFCRMLVHSLWQGLLLAIVVSIAHMATRKWKAAARYNLILLLFGVFLLTAVYTFATGWQHADKGNIVNNMWGSPDGRVAQLFFGNLQQIKLILEACAGYCAAHEQLIVLIWLLIFTARMCKMLGAGLYNRNMKQKMVSIPYAFRSDTIARLCAKLQIKKLVIVLESGCMKMPVVIGHIKPVILMPAGLLLQLSPDQAEAILLHELAHIKRNDYLVNFLQYIAEAIFFFNPAVWWISSLLREERENCCDDMALAHTKDKIGLAEALISFKEHQLYGSSLQIAFPGRKNQLLRRVSRIIGIENKAGSLSDKLFFGLAFVLLFAVVGSVMLVNGNEVTVNTNLNKKADNQTHPVPQPAVILPAIKNEAEAHYVHIATTAKKKTTIVDLPAGKKERTEAGLLREAAELTQEQMLAQDMAQARLDQEQALRDQKQAMLDQQQAEKDQRQYSIDRSDAQRMQEKAALDRQQALKDKQEAERLSYKKSGLN